MPHPGHGLVILDNEQHPTALLLGRLPEELVELLDVLGPLVAVLAHDERIVPRLHPQIPQEPLLRLVAHALPPRRAEEHLHPSGIELHERTDVTFGQIVEIVPIEGIPVYQELFEQPTTPQSHFGDCPVDVDDHDSFLLFAFHISVN